MSKAASVMLFTVMLPYAQGQRVSPPRFRVSRPATASRVFYPIPYLSDFLYPDMRGEYPAPPQPTVIVIESPGAAESVADRPPTPSDPLLIELQGDQYVVVSGDKTSLKTRVTEHQDAHAAQRISSGVAIPPRPQSLATVLVFRDGHREDVSEYTITTGVLYAKADYYADGAWNRAIQLSSLDLPETIQANQSRGISFRLPTAPNQVIVGP
jgi:hypothetical protein